MSYNDDDANNNVASAIKAGMALGDIHVHAIGNGPDGRPGDPLLIQVVPEGAKLEVQDLEKYLPRPTRKRGTYNFGDAKSFIEFVNREKTPETFILANRENPGFTAIFNGNVAQDGNADAEAGWGDYKAAYACPYSPEWKVWSAANKSKMTQHDFAVFVEDNWVDVIVPEATFDPNYTNWPDGQMLLRLALGLEGKNDVSWGSAQRLDNGQVRFKYEETISGQVQGAYIDIPQKFAVGIPVFAGTAPWQIIAKLRWRMDRGGLTMWFEFERLFKITERAFDEARAEIATGTGVPIYLGSKS